MLRNEKLIAIAGLKESGKSESAKMVCYLLNAPKCFRAYKWYKFFKGNTFRRKWKITSFAYPLKACLSILLNKPIDWFESRENKEQMYVSLEGLKVYPKYKIHENLRLTESKFQKLIKSGEPISPEYLLSVRQLMQYFGTNIMHRFISNKVWISATLNRNNSDNVIISDLRFRTELNEIKLQNGKTIYINRNSAVPGSHASEKEVLELLDENKFDYVVDNNGTLEDLYNKLKTILW